MENIFNWFPPLLIDWIKILQCFDRRGLSRIIGSEQHHIVFKYLLGVQHSLRIITQIWSKWGHIKAFVTVIYAKISITPTPINALATSNNWFRRKLIIPVIMRSVLPTIWFTMILWGFKKFLNTLSYCKMVMLFRWKNFTIYSIPHNINII